MKLTKQNLKDIRQFAREKIGGFGMYLELGEKIGYKGEVKPGGDWSGVESVYSYNLLLKCDEGTRDHNDFTDWSSLPKLEIEVIDGFVWLDFWVHDHEELKDNVHVLLNDKNEILKMWKTWANEDELKSLLVSCKVQAGGLTEPKTGYDI